MGISADPVDRQKEFSEINDLDYPLLSDPKRTIAAALGAKRIGPLYNKRWTFVIDRDATLLDIIKSEASMTAHADRALEVLRNR